MEFLIYTVATFRSSFIVLVMAAIFDWNHRAKASLNFTGKTSYFFMSGVTVDHRQNVCVVVVYCHSLQDDLTVTTAVIWKRMSDITEDVEPSVQQVNLFRALLIYFNTNHPSSFIYIYICIYIYINIRFFSSFAYHAH